MTNDDADSVTQWISDLKTDKRDEAFRRLWERCFPRLVNLAEARLRSTTYRPADRKDIARSVVESLFRRATTGRFHWVAGGLS
jgi:DNA-directed RNA polymerase specialized sigma24 family protein